MYHESYVDAQESVRIDPNEKACFRMGRAAYSMQQFSHASELFRKCLDINQKNKRASEELERSEERLRESETGEYNIKRLLKESNAGKLRLDAAEYVSSLIRIGDVKGKGKGVIANKMIKRGALLIVSKAVSIAYESEIKFPIISTNMITKKVSTPVRNQNMLRIVYKLQHDPHLAKKVLLL